MKFIRLARGCARTFCACGRLRETITTNNSLRDDQIRREKVFVLSLQTCFFDVDVVKLCCTTRAFVHKAEQHNMQGDFPPTENSAALGGYMTQSECRAPCIKRQFDFDRKKGGSDREDDFHTGFSDRPFHSLQPLRTSPTSRVMFFAKIRFV